MIQRKFDCKYPIVSRLFCEPSRIWSLVTHNYLLKYRKYHMFHLESYHQKFHTDLESDR